MTDQSEPGIIARDAVHTAVIRSREPMAELASFYDRVYPAVAAVVGEQGIQPGEAFGLYGPMNDGVVDIEVGFTVDRTIEPDGEVIGAELPAGDYAHVTHVGAYDQLSLSWGRLGAWITEQDRTAGQTVFEVYTDDPTDADPAALRTDLYWSLTD